MLFPEVVRYLFLIRICQFVWHLIVWEIKVHVLIRLYVLEVNEAIIWNHEKNSFIGIFNSSDLIKAILMQINRHRHDPSKVDDILLVDINAYRGTLHFQLLIQ